MPLTPGDRLGPYRIVSLLGAGGMGEVWLAEDERLHRRVALKKPPANLASPDARERLNREARAAARLNHPGIAGVYDVLEHDDQPIIVMEYVEGDTLSARLRGGPLRVEQTVEIGVQLADALAAAHAANVIHRDLKPSNIALTPGGRVKVLDFGIARIGGPAAEHETLGRAFGTPGYMAPEQLLGAPGDARADIYGLGAVLYELLTGRPPLARDTMGVPLAALTQRPSPVHAVNPAVPEALDAIVMRALERQPADRYRSAAQMRTELERVATTLRDRPTGELEIVGDRRTGPVAARRTGPLTLTRARWIAMVVALALAAGVGIPVARRWTAPKPAASNRAGQIPVLAVLSLRNLSGDVQVDRIAVGFADSLRTDLATLAGIRVIPSAAMRTYDRGGADTLQIMRELGVAFLLDGSLQQIGTRMRINFNLLRDDGGVEWSRGYDVVAEEDVIPLQRRVAEAVAEGLRLNLSARERERLGAQRTSNVAALDAYWRGQATLERADDSKSAEQAVAAFAEAIKLDSRFALAHAALADAYWVTYQQTRDPADAGRAIEAADGALKLDPQQSEVWISLGRVHHGTGQLDAAERDLRRALAIQPASDEARRLLGRVYADRGKYAEAEGEYRAAIDLRAGYWRGHYDLGSFYFRTARYQDAADAFTRAIELNSHYAGAFHNLGTAYQSLGDEARALENYKRAVAITPIAQTYANIGSIQFRQKRYEEAVASFRLAVQLGPGNPLTHGNLGDALGRVGRKMDAAESYARAVEASQATLRVNPNDAHTLARLAVFEAKLGRAAAAERDSARAVRINPQDPEVSYRQATVFALNGKIGPAMAALDAALTKGYSAAQAESDEDLAALRKLPAFGALLDKGRRAGGTER
jgi:tetratricopeptide (TPR) repeat protein